MIRIFDDEEKAIFDKIRPKSQKDLKIWNLANLLFPIATIAVSILLYFFSTKSPIYSNSFLNGSRNFLDFLLNGSIPLIGINLLVSCSFFLVKFDKNKEVKLGLTTGLLRLKLIVFTLSAYLFLSALFVIQTINSPFDNLLKQLILLTLSLVGTYISIQIANKLFFLQEEFIDKSYDEKMSEDIANLKNAIE